MRGEWRRLRVVPDESVAATELERLTRRVPLPPGARGVIVDCGRSVRFIITSDPVGERALEFTLGEESSFDCWIRGDWVREAVFHDLDRHFDTHHRSSSTTSDRKRKPTT